VPQQPLPISTPNQWLEAGRRPAGVESYVAIGRGRALAEEQRAAIERESKDFSRRRRFPRNSAKWC